MLKAYIKQLIKEHHDSLLRLAHQSGWKSSYSIMRRINRARVDDLQGISRIAPYLKLSDLVKLSHDDLAPLQQQIVKARKHVHDRKSYSHYLAWVAMKHGYDLTDLSRKIGHSKSFIFNVIDHDVLVNIIRLSKEIANELSIPSKLLIETLRQTNIPLGKPKQKYIRVTKHTFNGQKQEVINHIHSRKTLTQGIKTLLYMNGYNVVEACAKMNKNRYYLVDVVKTCSWQAIKEMLNKLVPLVHLTSSDVKKIESQITDRKLVTFKQLRKNRQELHYYLKFVAHEHHLSLEEISTRGGRNPMYMTNAIFETKKVNLRAFHRLMPDVSIDDMKKILAGDYQPIDNCLAIARKRVHDRHTFDFYLRNLLYFNGWSFTTVDEKLHRQTSYIPSALEDLKPINVSKLCSAISEVTHIAPDKILGVWKQVDPNAIHINNAIEHKLGYSLANKNDRRTCQKQIMSKITDRRSLRTAVTQLINLHNRFHPNHKVTGNRLSVMLGHHRSYFHGMLIQYKRSTINHVLKAVAPLIDLTPQDCDRMTEPLSLTATEFHHTHQSKSVRGNLRTYVYVNASARHLDLKFIARKHRLQGDYFSKYFSSYNKIHISRLKELMPYLSLKEMKQIENGSVKPIRQSLIHYGHVVRNRHDFLQYLRYVLSLHGDTLATISRRMHRDHTYVSVVIRSDSHAKVVEFCKRIADLAGIPPEILLKPIKLANKRSYRQQKWQAISRVHDRTSLSKYIYSMARIKGFSFTDLSRYIHYDVAQCIARGTVGDLKKLIRDVAPYLNFSKIDRQALGKKFKSIHFMVLVPKSPKARRMLIKYLQISASVHNSSLYDLSRLNGYSPNYINNRLDSRPAIRYDFLKEVMPYLSYQALNNLCYENPISISGLMRIAREKVTGRKTFIKYFQYLCLWHDMNLREVSRKLLRSNTYVSYTLRKGSYDKIERLCKKLIPILNITPRVLLHPLQQARNSRSLLNRSPRLSKFTKEQFRSHAIQKVHDRASLWYCVSKLCHLSGYSVKDLSHDLGKSSSYINQTIRSQSRTQIKLLLLELAPKLHLSGDDCEVLISRVHNHGARHMTKRERKLRHLLFLYVKFATIACHKDINKETEKAGYSYSYVPHLIRLKSNPYLKLHSIMPYLSLSDLTDLRRGSSVPIHKEVVKIGKNVRDTKSFLTYLKILCYVNGTTMSKLSMHIYGEPRRIYDIFSHRPYSQELQLCYILSRLLHVEPRRLIEPLSHKDSILDIIKDRSTCVSGLSSRARAVGYSSLRSLTRKARISIHKAVSIIHNGNRQDIEPLLKALAPYLKLTGYEQDCILKRVARKPRFTRAYYEILTYVEILLFFNHDSMNKISLRHHRTRDYLRNVLVQVTEYDDLQHLKKVKQVIPYLDTDKLVAIKQGDDRPLKDLLKKMADHVHDPNSLMVFIKAVFASRHKTLSYVSRELNYGENYLGTVARRFKLKPAIKTYTRASRIIHVDPKIFTDVFKRVMKHANPATVSVSEQIKLAVEDVAKRENKSVGELSQSVYGNPNHIKVTLANPTLNAKYMLLEQIMFITQNDSPLAKKIINHLRLNNR